MFTPLPSPDSHSTRVLGLRCLQLQNDTTATVECGNVRSQAVRELLDGRSAFLLRRTMPDGSFSDVRVSDLTIPDDLRDHLTYVLECQRTDPGY